MTHVDLIFPARGGTIPLDHGYVLYAALSRAIPALHQAEWLAVHPIGGTPFGRSMLALRRGSAVALRLPVDHIGTALPLAGRTLDLHGTRVSLAAPNIRPLQPSRSLDARIVVIKLTGAPEGAGGKLDLEAVRARYEAEMQRQLDKLGIARPFALSGRRCITVKGRRVIGFSTRVRDLEGEESLRLQIEGLGGKRAMGAGVFRPTRGANA